MTASPRSIPSTVVDSESDASEAVAEAPPDASSSSVQMQSSSSVQMQIAGAPPGTFAADTAETISDDDDGMPDHGGGDPWHVPAPPQLPVEETPEMAERRRKDAADRLLFWGGALRSRASAPVARGSLGLPESAGAAMAQLMHSITGGQRGLPPAVYDRAVAEGCLDALDGALVREGDDPAEHALRVIRRRLSGHRPRIYVGISEDPAGRFMEHQEVRRPRFQQMTIVQAAETSRTTAATERAIISRLARSDLSHLMLNMSAGGERPSEASPHYVYICFT